MKLPLITLPSSPPKITLTDSYRLYNVSKTPIETKLFLKADTVRLGIKYKNIPKDKLSLLGTFLLKVKSSDNVTVERYKKHGPKSPYLNGIFLTPYIVWTLS